MGFEDFITETEAASFTGVSVSTLSRFAEAGYLHIENDTDGLRLFSKLELKEVFGIQEGFHKAIETVRTPSFASTPPTSNLKPPNTVFTNTISPNTISTNTVSPNATSSNTNGEREEFSEPQQVEVKTGSQKIEEPIRSSISKEGSAPIVNLLEDEILKLKSVLSMQEKILELKDQENRSLKEDRDWLRTRLERQEDKGERDQLLLLSETQMIRKLISIQEQEPKKSSIRLALEWLGFVAPQPSMSSNTIDVVKRETT